MVSEYIKFVQREKNKAQKKVYGTILMIFGFILVGSGVLTILKDPNNNIALIRLLFMGFTLLLGSVFMVVDFHKKTAKDISKETDKEVLSVST